MEGPRGDEQDVVGAYGPVLRGHGAALHQWQQVALDPLAGDIGAAHPLAAAGHLVDLIEEDDAVLLDVLDRPQLELLLVDPLGRLLVAQHLAGIADAQLAPLGAALAEVLEEPLELAGHLLHARRGHDLHPQGGGGDLYLDLAVVQIPGAQLVAELLAGRARRRGSALLLEARGGRKQGIEDALLGCRLGLIAQPGHLLLAGHLHRHVGEVADHGLHVPADVAHLGELGRLHLDEGGVRQARQAPRDLGLAHARGPDHEDVLGRDLRAQGLVDLHTPPTVAQGDGHRALGVILTDDMLIQLGDDGLGGDFRIGGHAGLGVQSMDGCPVRRDECLSGGAGAGWAAQVGMPPWAADDGGAGPTRGKIDRARGQAPISSSSSTRLWLV